MKTNETNRRQYFAYFCYGDRQYAKLRYAEPGDPIPDGRWERITRRDALQWRTAARDLVRCRSRTDIGDTEIIPFQWRDFYDHTKIGIGATARIYTTKYGADLFGIAGTITDIERDGFGETIIRLADERNNRFSVTLTLDEIDPR